MRVLHCTRHGARHRVRRVLPPASIALFCALSCALSACALQPMRADTARPDSAFAEGAASVSPPPGAGWTRARQTGNLVLFRKHASTADARPDPSPYLITAGAMLASRSVFPADSAASVAAFRAMLASQMTNRRQELVELDATPEQRQGIGCIAYRALQVERYSPESTEPRYQFRHRGYLCPLPGSPSRSLQVFYTEQTLRAVVQPEQRASVREAGAFLDTVRIRLPLPTHQQ
jgi:Spy/CpxP family protein refolding chaperone